MEFLRSSVAVRHYDLPFGLPTHRAQCMQPEAQFLISRLSVASLNRGTRHKNAVKQSANGGTTRACAQSLTYAADAHRHLQRFLTVCGCRHAATGSVAEFWARTP